MKRFRVAGAFALGFSLILSIACGTSSESTLTVPPPDKGTSAAPGNAASAPASLPAGNASLNLSKSLEGLEKLKSFRFDMAMKMDFGAGTGADSGLDGAFAAAFLGLFSDIKAQGAFVAPDQMDVSMTFAGQQMGYIQIGDKAWEKTGATWKSTMASSTGFDMTPSAMFSDFLPSQALSGAKTTRESINGSDTTHYSFDRKALESMAKELGETANLAEFSDANLDIWVRDDQIPVKMLMNMAGKDEGGQKVAMKLEMNIKDINDSGIKIKAPV